jgi:peroxiredoxin
MAARLQPGDQAPDVSLVGITGQPATLSEYWKNGPVLISFLRHFG